MVARHVGVQLLLSNFFYKFGKGRNNGDRSIVGWISRITGFVDGVDDGVLPGCGKFTSCETGVDEVKEDVTDGIETEAKDPYADTVGAGGGGVFHGKKDVSEGLKGNRF